MNSLLIIAAVLALYGISQYIVRREVKRQAAEMTDDELRSAALAAGGATLDIYYNEICRRDDVTGMMERAQ